MRKGDARAEAFGHGGEVVPGAHAERPRAQANAIRLRRHGIVTFDGSVTTALDATTDRASAQSVINGLELSKGTLLYDGILAAVDLAGQDGQRSILVLSDGADTGDTPLVDVTAEVGETATLVDVVSLDQKNKPKAVAALTQLATACQGSVIESSGAALSTGPIWRGWRSAWPPHCRPSTTRD
jgi:hypothetical protein